MLKRVATSGKRFQKLSTEITAEAIKANALMIEKFKKLNRTTMMPKTMTDVMIPGMDPELPKDISELAVLNGMPALQSQRRVEIAPYPIKTLQAGDRFHNVWQIKWPREQERWSNSLMGWTSTADPMSNMELNFDDRADAIAFAERNGWEYDVKAEVSERVVEAGDMQYGHNFLPKRTMEIVRSEGGVKSKQFNNPGYGSSNWFMPLTYNGQAEVEQFGERAAKKK